MFMKRQVSENIEAIDVQIGKLNERLSLLKEDEDADDIMDQLKDLTKIRCELAESRGINSAVRNTVVSGIFGITSIIIVLKYEEREVITSKAFGMLPSLFKGSR